MMAKEVWKGGIGQVSTSLADFFGLGIAEPLEGEYLSGRERTVDGKLYVLCLAEEDIEDGCLVKQGAVVTGVVSVIKTEGSNQSAIGVNNTGAQVDAGNYFWALKRGRGYALSGGTMAGAGVVLSHSGGGGKAGTTANTAVTGNWVLGQCLEGTPGADNLDNQVQWNCR